MNTALALRQVLFSFLSTGSCNMLSNIPYAAATSSFSRCPNLLHRVANNELYFWSAVPLINYLCLGVRENISFLLGPAGIENTKISKSNIKEIAGIGHLLQLKKYLLQMWVKRHKWTWILQWYSWVPVLLPEHRKHTAAMAEVAQNSPFWMQKCLPGSFKDYGWTKTLISTRWGNTGLSVLSSRSIEVCIWHSLKDLRDIFLASHKPVALKNFHLECESLEETNKS